jgi:thioredoxin
MKKISLLMAAFLATLTMNAFAQSDSLSAENAGEVIVLNKADFIKHVWDYKKNPDQWIYAGTLPCIIDFYADWCGPCRRVAPIMKDLAKEYKGKVLFYKVNVDNEQELSSIFQIKSIPAYLFIPPNTE